MRQTQHLPWFVLAAAAAATIVLMRPIIGAGPFLAGDSHVKWIAPAAADFRPRRPLEGEDIRSLRTPAILSSGGSRQYWLAIDRPPNMSRYGVFFPVAPAGTRVFINGVQIDVQNLGPPETAAIAEVPASGYQVGPNRIELVAPSGAPYAWPRAIFFGPLDVVKAAALRHAAVQRWGMVAITGFGLLSAALGFFSAFFIRERLHLALPSLAALILAGLASLTLFAWPPGDMFLKPWAHLMLAAGAALVLLLMTASESAPWPRWTTIAFRASGAGIVILLVALLASRWDRAGALASSHAAGIATSLVCCGVALGLALAGRDVRSAWSPLQRSVGVLTALALTAASLADIGPLGGLGWIAAKSAFAVIASAAIALWFLWMGVRVFLDAEAGMQKRLGLGRIIKEQEAQLNAQREALEKELVQRAVHEERERFSRDIHDGVGGSLVSLLAQARTGVLNAEELEATVQRALVDLRLTIDALDHAQATLDAAFSTFQTRIAPVFAGAGIALVWRQEGLGERELKEPSSLLHVSRILQEACTNIIKHAAASRASVCVLWDGAGNALDLIIDDDGAPVEGAGGSGRGLKNMAERARSIGASFFAGPAPSGRGWRVRLSIPGR